MRSVWGTSSPIQSGRNAQTPPRLFPCVNTHGVQKLCKKHISGNEVWLEDQALLERLTPANSMMVAGSLSLSSRDPLSVRMILY